MPDTPDDAAPALTLESALLAAGAPAARAGPPASRPARATHGLRTGLLLMLAIGLMPALAGTAWYLQHLRDTAVADAYGQADLIALGTAERLHWLMQDAQASMASLAARPKVMALDGNDCDPVFRDFRDINPAFKAISLRRLDGSPVCSELQQPPSRAAVAGAAWFQAAVRQRGFHASDAHIGAVQQVWTARLTYPVVGPGGRIEGLLVTPIDLDQLQRRLFAQLPAPAVAAIVDGSNAIVVRSELQNARVGKPAAEGVARMLDALRRARQSGTATASSQFAEVGIDGTRRLYAIRGVPLTSWAVVAALPEEETLRPYETSRKHALLAIVSVLGVVLLAAWWVSRGILVPIHGLALAARGVAAGRTDLRAPESGPHEIVEVAREFNRMVDATTAATERLQASERHHRTLVQHLPVGIVTCRADGSIELFNPRACALLRVTPQQLLDGRGGARAWQFVDSRRVRLDPARFPVQRVLDTGQPTPSEVLGIVAEDGTAPHTWVMVAGYPQFDERGRLARAIAVFVDVTAQHLGEELRVAKEAAEAASLAKSTFLSRVSHELRTPLNAINGFSELMLLDDRLPADSKGRLRHVLGAGQHLLSLINQILDLTRIESGELQVSAAPLALWPVLEECVAICEPIAQARGVVLRLVPGPRTCGPDDAPLQVLGDATRLRQVLNNLLSNAIKYNRPQGTVTVIVEAAELPAGQPAWSVQVHDTGLGMRPQQIDELFQPFNRLGAEFSGIEGHGLGLTISRLLARSMLGEITVRSDPGQGSCFALLLRSADQGLLSTRSWMTTSRTGGT